MPGASCGSGSREVIDAIVAPGAPGALSPSPPRSGKGRAPTTGWTPAHRTRLIRPVGESRAERWLLHGTLALLTVICALGAGAALAGRGTRRGPRRDSARARCDLGGAWVLSRCSGRRVARHSPRRRLRFPLLSTSSSSSSGTISPHGGTGSIRRPVLLPCHRRSLRSEPRRVARLRTPVLDRRNCSMSARRGRCRVRHRADQCWRGGTPPPKHGRSARDDRRFVTFAGRQIYLGDSLLTLGMRKEFFPEAAASISASRVRRLGGRLITRPEPATAQPARRRPRTLRPVGKRQALLGGLALAGV